MSHTYAYCGSYVVRVEAINTYGNHTLDTQTINVTTGCVPDPGTIYLPLIRRS